MTKEARVALSLIAFTFALTQPAFADTPERDDGKKLTRPYVENFRDPAEISKDGSKKLTRPYVENFRTSGEVKKNREKIAARIISRLDTNKDGKVSKKEWSISVKRGNTIPFQRIDTNGDHSLTKAELSHDIGQNPKKGDLGWVR